MKNNMDKSRILMGIIAALALASIVFVLFQVRTDKVADELKIRESLAVVLTVHDEGKPLFSEVLLYNPQTRKAAVFDLPSETGSLITSLNRMDSVDVLFNPDSPEAFTKKVEDLLGRPIPFYMVLPLEGVGDLTDLLGGVDIFNSDTFEEVNQEPMVLLPSGTAVLDGEKIKTFISLLEKDAPETDRISRHQKFFQSLLRKMGEQKDFLLRPEVLKLVARYVKTNMEELGLSSFIAELPTMDLERLVFQRVIGSRRLVDGKEILFPSFNGNLLKETVNQTWESLKSGEIEGLGFGVKIEVQNGTIQAGLAGRTVNLFKSFGYDVLPGKNAENTDVEKTTVIVRKGDLELGQKIAQYIKCTNIIAQEDPAYRADVTVLLGKDFDGRQVRTDN